MTNAIDQYLTSPVSPTGQSVFCPTVQNLGQITCPVLIMVPYNPVVVTTPPSVTQNKILVINNQYDAVALYGAKTLAYRAAMVALAANANLTAVVNILALPVLSPTFSVKTISIAGSATSSHVKTFNLLGTNYPVYIASGAPVATIAASLKALLDADPMFPFTVAIVSSGVTLTANDAGTAFTGMVLTTTDSRTGVAITDTIVTMVSTTVGAGALDPTSLISAVGACCYPYIVTSDATQTVVDAMVALLNVLQTCGPDYCGCMGYFARRQTVGTALTFGNGVPGSQAYYNEVIIGLQIHPTIPYLEQDIAITRAVGSAMAGCLDPGNPLSNISSKMLNLPFPTLCNGLYTRTELNQLFQAGWTTIKPIEGFLGLEFERTFHRYDGNGQPTIAYSDPTQIRIAQYFYRALLAPWLLNTFGSMVLFKDGTTIPINKNLPANAPAFMKNANATNPTLFKGQLVSFMEQYVGIIFDDQDLPGKIFAAPDDTLRALCQGDPRVLVVFFDKISIARPLRQFFLSFNYTPRTC